jgi:excisionase family DNA binding protein
MKFIKQLNQADNDAQPPIDKPVPMRPKDLALPDDSNSLTDLCGVARKLGVSKRFVQVLVRRNEIPVIRLGRRCNRFDLDSVMTAVKRRQIDEAR